MENNGKGIFYGVIGVATLIVAIIGATFAYFTATGGSNNSISGTTATASNVTLAVERVAPTTAGKLVPLASSSDMATALSKSCKDDNGYDACQVYSITVTNSAGDAVYATTSLQLTVGTVANAKWQLLTGSSKDDWALDSSFTAVTSHTSATNVKATESLASSGTVTYYVVVWVEDNDDQTSTDAGQTITGSVTTNVVNSSGTSLSNLKATFSAS